MALWSPSMSRCPYLVKAIRRDTQTDGPNIDLISLTFRFKLMWPLCRKYITVSNGTNSSLQTKPSAISSSTVPQHTGLQNAVTGIKPDDRVKVFGREVPFLSPCSSLLWDSSSHWITRHPKREADQSNTPTLRLSYALSTMTFLS
jgi:hypothetical protein